MRSLFAGTLILLFAVAPTVAHADPEADRQQARAHFQKGQAAFDLGHYDRAADEYEAAYSFKQDPALLYDAAQAHRLHGNKQRALLLYRNYLRLYGDTARNRGEVEKQIDALRLAIDSEKRTMTEPPLQPMSPTRGDQQRHEEAPPPTQGQGSPTHDDGATHAQPTTSAPAAAVTPPPPAEPEPPRSRKPLFIGIAVAGAVIVLAGVGIGIGVAASTPIDPTPTFGAGTLH